MKLSQKKAAIYEACADILPPQLKSALILHHRTEDQDKYSTSIQRPVSKPRLKPRAISHSKVKWIVKDGMEVVET